MSSLFIFGGHNPFSWSHWCPCFGLLVTSELDFKATVDPSHMVVHHLHGFFRLYLMWHLMTVFQKSFLINELAHAQALVELCHSGEMISEKPPRHPPPPLSTRIQKCLIQVNRFWWFIAFCNGTDEKRWIKSYRCFYRSFTDVQTHWRI